MEAGGETLPFPLECYSPSLFSIPQSWKWVLAPVLLYIFERILRIWRARQKVVVTKVCGAGACVEAPRHDGHGEMDRSHSGC